MGTPSSRPSLRIHLLALFSLFACTTPTQRSHRGHDWNAVYRKRTLSSNSTLPGAIVFAERVVLFVDARRE